VIAQFLCFSCYSRKLSFCVGSSWYYCFKRCCKYLMRNLFSWVRQPSYSECGGWDPHPTLPVKICLWYVWRDFEWLSGYKTTIID
jgi:hypothetical protein